MKLNLTFLKEEGSNRYSFTRVTAFILTLMYIFAFMYKLIKDGQVIDLPANLAMALVGLYGFNKVSAAVVLREERKTKKSKKNNDDW